MKIEIDPESGCCHGVLRAIEQAERQLSERGSLFSLGAIVHNGTELDRLAGKGLKIIDYDTFDTLHDEKVLIRAHGEPPSIYKTAEEHGLHLIDCTCAVVLKLQKKIASTYKLLSPEQGQIVIFGKRGHAEVNGLIGQVEGNALVIENKDDLSEAIRNKKINLHRPIAIFSQTTKDTLEYNIICNTLREEIIRQNGNDATLSVFDTICRQVSSRHPHLIEFSKSHSIIIFVSGKESSNGKILYSLCKDSNPRSYMIESTDEIRKEWFVKEDFVGICGATSTPLWQLEEVSNFLLTLPLI